MNSPETKQCTSCGKALPLSEFYRNKGGISYFPRCKECVKAYQRSRVKQHIINNRRYRKRHSKRYKARNLIQRKVTTGEIKAQPCVICGQTPTEAHHFNYDKPGVVVWLCSKCHGEAHRLEGNKIKTDLRDILNEGTEITAKLLSAALSVSEI